MSSAAQDYEQKEAQWKEQISKLHAKLTQAGNHLKTLAQENAQLTQQVKKYEEERKRDEQSVMELTRLLETIVLDKEEEKATSIPLPDNYVSCLRDRLEQEQRKHKELVESLQRQIESKNEKATASSSIPDGMCSIEAVQQSLENLMQDVENGTLSTSLPPELLRVLEDVRGKWLEQIESAKRDQASMTESHKDLKRQVTQLQLSVNSLTEEKEKLTSDKEELENRVEELTKAEQQLREAEERYQKSEEKVKSLQQEHESLLGKLAHIKETLAPRLEADKQLRQRVSELSSQLDTTRMELERARRDILVRDEEASKQITEKEHEISELRLQVEHLQQEKEEWQVNAMQSDAQRVQLAERSQHLEDELETLRQEMKAEAEKYELERASLSNLQTVLEEFQATKDAEVRAAVEHIERQLEVAKKSWAEYQERARVAEAALEQYQQDVGKAQQYEKEIKEKNLLIGKLRHEAIILNEHLIEAMRRLKEESNESNVDRQLITNLIVGFFMAPRGDRRRFEILSIIASVLQMSDEQKEQIGLLRPSKNNNRSSPALPGWASPPPAAQREPQENDTRESFTDAWISFLLKESNAYGRPGSGPNSRNPSAPTSPRTNPTTNEPA
ncbi:hypothetical protein VTP01DRAFT_4979 [Rhizomucor pusillus]|uniref:uncharacterized protein n=1 Tax=Rhizomucor pusillus TaxID=4840 RepID=UPI0037432D07